MFSLTDRKAREGGKIERMAEVKGEKRTVQITPKNDPSIQVHYSVSVSLFDRQGIFWTALL